MLAYAINILGRHNYIKVTFSKKKKAYMIDIMGILEEKIQTNEKY